MQGRPHPPRLVHVHASTVNLTNCLERQDLNNDSDITNKPITPSLQDSSTLYYFGGSMETIQTKI